MRILLSGLAFVAVMFTFCLPVRAQIDPFDNIRPDDIPEIEKKEVIAPPAETETSTPAETETSTPAETETETTVGGEAVPVGEDPAKAHRRLLQEVEELQARREDRLKTAEKFYESAVANRKNANFERARQDIRQALIYDPYNQKFSLELDTIDSLLGRREMNSKEVIEWMEKTRTAKSNNKRSNITRYLAQAAKKAEEKEFADAIEKLDGALVIIRVAPKDYGELAKVVQAKLLEYRQMQAKHQRDLGVDRKIAAEIDIHKTAQSQKNRRRDTLAAQMAEAKDFHAQGDFEKAKRMLRVVLATSPNNSEASSLMGKWEEEFIRSSTSAARKEFEHQQNLQSLEMAWLSIPYVDRIRYPDNWEEITRIRRPASIFQNIVQKSDEDRRLEKLLISRRISFDFDDDSFSDALDMLRLQGINIIVPNQDIETSVRDATVKMRVENMRLKDAITYLFEFNNFRYIIKNGALLVTTEDEASTQRPMDPRVYDVSDLVGAIAHFPPPEVSLFGEPTIVDVEEEQAGYELDKLQELIQQLPLPPGQSWDDDTSTMVGEDDQGRLIINTFPAVHEDIEKLLDGLRKSRALQITVQMRVIEVQDFFVERYGVNFTGLDQNNTLVSPAFASTSGEFSGFRPRTPISAPNYDAAGAASAPEQGMLPVYMERYQPDATNFPELWSNRMTVVPDGQNVAPGLGNNESIIGYTRAEDFYNTSYALAGNITPHWWANADLIRHARNRLTVGATGEGLNLSFAFMDDLQVGLLVRAVRASQKGTIVQAPMLTMFNNQMAYCFMGNERAYVKDTDAVGSGGAMILEPIPGTTFEGIIFSVRPIASADRKYVQLNMQPDVFSNLTFADMASRYQGAPGAMISVIEMPERDVQRVRTTVSVPDGGSIMLTGLANTTDIEYESGVPILSKIPIIKHLFTTKGISRERWNLIFLIRAQILLLEEEEAKLRL